MDTRFRIGIAFLFLFLIIHGSVAQVLSFDPKRKFAHNQEISGFKKAIEGKRIVFLGDIFHGEANVDSLRASW